MFTTYHHPILTWSTWQIIGPDDSPKQSNAYDCGVFLCMTIAYLAMGSQLTFTQTDIPLGRQHIAKCILANLYCISEDRPIEATPHAQHTKLLRPRVQSRPRQHSNSNVNAYNMLRTTRRPLSPVLRAPMPDSPQTAQTHNLLGSNAPPSILPPPTPLHVEG